MDRRLSNASKDLYSNIDTRFNEKKDSCPIGLVEVKELDNYFKWIFIPRVGADATLYSLDDFKAYFDSENAFHFGHVRDPMRIYSNLSFMETRMNRLLKVSDDLRKLSASQINDDLRKEVLHGLLTKVFGLDGFEVKSDSDLIKSLERLYQLSVIVGINTFATAGFVHDLTAENVGNTLQGLPVGSFLIRTSSKSSTTGMGECSVFTISYVNASDDYFNIRFLDIHGVGIYTLTPGHANSLRRVSVFSEFLESGNMIEILKQLNWKAPHYACVLDCLTDLNMQGLIKLPLIIKKSS